MKRKIGLFSLSFLVSSTAIALPKTDGDTSGSQKVGNGYERTVKPKSNIQMPSLAGYSNLLHSSNQNTNYKKSSYQKNTHANKQDTLRRLTAVASSSMSNFSQSGLASWYGKSLHGKKTASGEVFNMNAMTAAHHTLTLGSYVKVTNKRNGKSIVVKINDRMPASNKRVIDISYAAAKKINMDSQGTGNVIIERINKPMRHAL